MQHQAAKAVNVTGKLLQRSGFGQMDTTPMCFESQSRAGASAKLAELEG